MKKFDGAHEPSEIIRKAEVKRIAEQLKKSELCSVMGIQYNYYCNCASVRDEPSQALKQKLERYLEMPTAVVYESVFALRDSVKSGAVKKDKHGRETYHENLVITKDYEDIVLSEMEENKVFKKPKMYDEQ